MTWTRKECKTRAKEALQRNYWKIVLVSFLALLFCGGYPAARSWGPKTDVQTPPETQTADASAASDTEVIVHMANPFTDNMEMSQTSILIPDKVKMAGTTILVLTMISAIAVLYIPQALLINPFQVGVDRFMIKSMDGRANVSEITYGFDHSYKNVVKTMFHYDLRVFLWALLFIIPGFYKQYQYRMVPYILAEHPDMNYKEVLQRSAILMNGHKWNAFVLDLSFILWHLLGLITCGIVEIFYTSPYHNLTSAALYRKLIEMDDITTQAQPELLTGEETYGI